MRGLLANLVGWFGALSLFSSVALAEQRPMDKDLTRAFESGALSGLHGVLVLKGPEVLAESYFSGRDDRWGQDLGERLLIASDLHDLRSVTKSVVGLLYGIALDEGLVPSLDAPLLASFPEYADLAGEGADAAMLVRHALTMTMGVAWDETLPYTDPRNSEIAMERAGDRYRFILDRPRTHYPGGYWKYSGGAVTLIGRLIEKGSGQSLEAFAKTKLFDPLGITTFEWVGRGEGEPSAASGLRLTMRDLGKIGRMVAEKGRWNGRQVVPDSWIDQSLAPQTHTGEGLDYGFFWWLTPEQWRGPPWVAGFGNGGQRLLIDRENDLVLVVFAGNYNQPDSWKLPVKIYTDFVRPALQKK
ncbi:MAG: beta-lactamase family protein [Rhodospirillum sp.]|nr:beta-lactamase family protein [Rhodospirillum sp.]MCF8492021.1 beta-lactamase family protein [Rhodospirillum sp.]MCF8502195.1 beta-lactamase family protein [Rhodospirillum sp.]